MTDAETVRQWLDLDAPQEAHEALGRLAGRHQRRRRSMTDHANTIRNGLLPRDAHHKFCNTRRDIGRDCDCYYSLRRDGKVAHDALDALLAGHAAEVERFSSELRRFKGLADEQHAKYIEARADAETLRQENDRLRQYAWHKRTCSGLWPDGDRRSTPCDCGFDPALDAAQEPPADECSYCGLTLEPGETHAQHPDAGCVAQEPPAEGGDR